MIIGVFNLCHSQIKIKNIPKKNEYKKTYVQSSYENIPFIRRTSDEDPLIPVTVRMVLQSKPPQLKDGRDPSLIKMVAAVREVIKTNQHCQTSIIYNVEDGTGLVKVKQFINFEYENSAETKMRREASKENVYVRIIGKIVNYTDGHNPIIADSVRTISTGNELTHHLLEVVHSGEKLKQKQKTIIKTSNMIEKTSDSTNATLTKTILNLLQGTNTYNSTFSILFIDTFPLISSITFP